MKERSILSREIFLDRRQFIYYMLKTILVGILISMVIIPLGNSFSQSSTNQTSDIVVVEGPEAKANLDRFDKLDFDAWNKKKLDTQSRDT